MWNIKNMTNITTDTQTASATGDPWNLTQITTVPYILGDTTTTGTVTVSDSTSFRWGVPAKSPPYKSFYIQWPKKLKPKIVWKLYYLGVTSWTERVEVYSEFDYKLRKHVIKNLERRGILIPIISC